MLPWCSLFAGFVFLSGQATAQVTGTNGNMPMRSVAPESSFINGISNEGSMGRRYRLEWSVSVQAPETTLDQLYGGLMPLRAETVGAANILYLHSASGQLFALRPLRLYPERQLPDIYQNTIVSGFANDLASAFHPYAPLTIAPMARAAGLPFAPAKLLFLPNHSALGPYAGDVGNSLHLLHQQPFSMQADTLFDVVRTGRLLQLLDSTAQYRVDEAAYLRSRLLDMLLGISLRRQEDWRWIGRQEAGATVFTPYTESYEGAYPLYEGRLVKLARVVAKPKGLVPFEAQLPDPRKLNETALYLDHRFTSSLTRSDWERLATSLQQALSDEVLQQAVQQMPPEILSFSAQTILSKLKTRRSQLVPYALKYYKLLSREVNVSATKSDERIAISGEGRGKLNVTVAPLQGSAGTTPLLQRNFDAAETRSVNVYGRGGRDRFEVAGTPGRKIKVRVIGGPGNDTLVGDTRSRIHFYDDRSVRPLRSRQVRLHLRNNASVHRYEWEDFAFDRRGLSPIIFYNNTDRIYAGLTYQWTKMGWRKQPFAQQHKLQLNYSILQGGISAGYDGVFNQLIGRWNGLVSLEYDAVRWTNFFGIGNESPPQVEDNNFYRMRTKIGNASVGLFRNFGKGHSIGFSGVVQMVQVRNDTDRYVAKFMSGSNPKIFDNRRFAGGRATYAFQSLDNEILPHKGLMIQGNASYLQNLDNREKEVVSYDGSLQTFIPFSKRVVWSMLGGVKAVTGEPEFFQMAVIGGGPTLRGFRRERFWGKTAFYTQNELQYLFPFRSYWFNGTVGLFGLFDAGRIWHPGEVSDVLHKSIGGGLIISPYHKLRVSLAFAKSEERGMIHVGFRGNL
jgi:hypothetical protein